MYVWTESSWTGRSSAGTEANEVYDKRAVHCPITAKGVSQQNDAHKAHTPTCFTYDRAEAAQEYPNAHRRAIRKGLVQQIQADREGRFLVALPRPDSNQVATEITCIKIAQ